MSRVGLSAALLLAACSDAADLRREYEGHRDANFQRARELYEKTGALEERVDELEAADADSRMDELEARIGALEARLGQ